MLRTLQEIFSTAKKDLVPATKEIPTQSLLDRIEHWSFQDWQRPEYISPQGQALDTKRRIGKKSISLSISRYLNSVDIAITQGTHDTGVYKGLYRTRINPEEEKPVYTYETDSGLIEYDEKENRWRRISDPQAFADFIGDLRKKSKTTI